MGVDLTYRPLIWAGAGIRLQGEAERFRKFIEEKQLPCVLTWGGADLLPTDHPLNIGIVGVSGQPGANKAVHECDWLIVLGSQFGLTQVGPISPKAETVIHHSVKDFLDSDIPCSKLDQWEMDFGYLKTLNVLPDVGSYKFNNRMTRMLPPNTCMVIDGGGTALYTGFQSSYIKEGSRLICSTAISAMGSGLPEAVGACFASGKRLTTCLVGDGSLMFNLQELQTIKHHNLPIKIFVLNNSGYLAIRHTQEGFLESRFRGTGAPDISFPKISILALAFGLPHAKIEDPYDEELIGEVLDEPGPVLCEVLTPQDQKMVRQGFKQENGVFKAMPLSEMVF